MKSQELIAFEKITAKTLPSFEGLAQGHDFIHIFSPCPTGWRMPASNAVEIAKLAVKTNIYPLYEVVQGEYSLRKRSKSPLPVSEYCKLQGRFKHLTEREIKAV